MGGMAMRGGFGKERNLPGSGVECLGMRWACVAEAAARYSCARGWHPAGDPDDMSSWHRDTPNERTSGFEVWFELRVNIESNGKH